MLYSIGNKTHTINFLEANITKTDIKKDEACCKERFVHVTDIEITNKNYKTISDYGRLRWETENEGFNEQKKIRVQAEPQILQKIIQRNPELLPMPSDSTYDQPTGTQNQMHSEYDRQP